jgi:hypothetical protein
MIILFLWGFSFSQEYTRGVVQTIEASFCMDFCSMYYLEPDSGFMATNLTTTPIIILEEYVGQHVEIWGEQTWCVECGALDVDEIMLIEEPNCNASQQLGTSMSIISSTSNAPHSTHQVCSPHISTC